MKKIDTININFKTKEELVLEQKRIASLQPKEILLEIKKIRMPYEQWNMFVNGLFLANMKTTQRNDSTINRALSIHSKDFISFERFQHIFKSYNKIIEKKYESKSYIFLCDQTLFKNWKNIENKINPFTLFRKYVDFLDFLGILEGRKCRIEKLKEVKLTSSKSKILTSLETDYNDSIYEFKSNYNIDLSDFSDDPEKIVEFTISKMEEICLDMDEVYNGLENQKNFCRSIIKFIKKYRKQIIERLFNIRTGMFIDPSLKNIKAIVTPEEFDYLKSILNNNMDELNWETTNLKLREISRDEQNGNYKKFYSTNDIKINTESDENFEIDDYVPIEKKVYYGLDGTTFDTLDDAIKYNELYVFVKKKL